MSIRSCTF